MKSLFSMSLDVVDHAMNSDLEKVANVVQSLSDKAKTAYVPSYEEQQERSDKDFAVILWHPELGSMPKYATYTPGLIELNMSFLVDKMNELPEEVVKVAATNLTCAAKKHHIDIPEELGKYASASDKCMFVPRLVDTTSINEKEYLQKTAKKECEPAKKVYALNKKYPIHTPEHIKKAAAWFDVNSNKLSIDEIREFISNIARESSQQKVDLEKTAALSYKHLNQNAFNEDFFHHVQVRKSYLTEDNEDVNEAYNDLLRRSDEIGPLKVAYVMEALDKEAGLDELYGSKLLDPLRATLGITKKAGMDIDGRFVSPDELHNINVDDLSAVVGNDVTKELRGDNGVTILASLPKPIRNEVLNLI